MPALNVFDNSAFSTIEMTKSINIIPNNYGLIRELGIFKEKGIRTTSVMIERKNNMLNLLPRTQRGGEGSKGTVGKRNMISLIVPNYTHDDSILADDVQNVRAFDTENELETVEDVVIDKLTTMRNKHDITLEFMRSGALQGKILDSDGSLIYDLYKEFEVDKPQYQFKFTDNNADMNKVLRDVKRKVEENLMGETMSYLQCLCSSEFFDKLVAHPSIKEAYHAYQGTTAYREDLRKNFVHQGITFTEYVGSASNVKGTNFKFIPDNEAIFLPMGTTNVFETVFAPADYEETVNTAGLPVYAKQEPMKFNRGRDIQTQSNPLPLCKRPEVLVRGY